MMRLLWITIVLGFYRWAMREIHPLHGDVPHIAATIARLHYAQRAEIRRLRTWRSTSPTLSAVKNWL